MVTSVLNNLIRSLGMCTVPLLTDYLPFTNAPRSISVSYFNVIGLAFSEVPGKIAVELAVSVQRQFSSFMDTQNSGACRF